MARQTAADAPRRARRGPRDLGRDVARVLCVVFALIGLLPLLGGLVLRSRPLQRWAAGETSRLLREQLGVEARFGVELSLLPLRLAVTDLVVPSSDGGAPALTTGMVSVSPRFFSLLAGRIDVGDVELEDGSVRLVVSGGKIQNVRYRFPETSPRRKAKLDRAPFRSLAVTNARLELDLAGTHIETGSIDLDAFAEPGLTFDVSLRAAGGQVTASRPYSVYDRRTKTTSEGLAVDEDQLCALELRASLARERVVLRRLSLLGGMDVRAAPGTRPRCEALGEEEKVAVRLAGVVVEPRETGLPKLRGHVMVRAPAPIVNRWVKMAPLVGWAGFSGEVAYDGSRRLPEVEGRLSGAGLRLERYGIAERLEAEVVITGDVVQVPHLEVRYANGDAVLEGVRVEPLAPGIPVRFASMRSTGVNFPGLMRDIGVTDDTIVEWNLGETEVTDVTGRIQPFRLAGRVTSDTRDFAVNAGAWHDPGRRRMIGVAAARIDGHFRADTDSLDFYDTATTFGSSSLPIDLVSIGFANHIVVRLKEGAVLDLDDVSPIAGVSVSGKSRLMVDMSGDASHPKLEGQLAVDDLSIGGFEVGDLEDARVHFEPLWVELLGARGRKGAMAFTLPRARLSFGESSPSRAGVEFDAEVDSAPFVVSEFFDIFDFDEDPRFAEVSGKGRTRASVRYLLGGPADVCGGGRLVVDGRARLDEVGLFGETFNGGEGEYHFEWFDMRAGARGFRLAVPSLALSKGSGTLFGSGRVGPGGSLQGELVGSRVPVARIDALGAAVARADGFVTGTATLGGTLEAMSLRASLGLTELRAGRASLPPSTLTVELVPEPSRARSTGERTACGRPVPAPFDPAEYARDERDGTFHVNGQLLGGQIRLEDLSISSQRAKVLSGDVVLTRLDVGALGAFLAGGVGAPLLGSGSVSGRAHLERLYLERPFASDAELRLESAALEVQSVELRLARPGALRLKGGRAESDGLELAFQTPSGQRGLIDARASLDSAMNVSAELALRETTLGVLAPALPGVSRADGRLAARLGVSGRLSEPIIEGQLEVTRGELGLSGLDAPLTELELTVAVDRTGVAVRRGSARWGGGTVTLTGGAPLSGGALGRVDLGLKLRDVNLPVADDVRVRFDADLRVDVPAPGDKEARLPRLTGSVDVLSGDYRRPVSVTADLASLASRARKSEVEVYDPEEDLLELDVLVRSRGPLKVAAELVEAEMLIDDPGLRVTGTNQRFGAVGSVEVPAGGQLIMRGSKFEVTSGSVRFNDATRLRPEVDVSAVTEYRRYQDRDLTTVSSATPTSSLSTTTGGRGSWRILLHGYGPPDSLRVDLTSDPPLAQDDIFLLLTVGMTRTELDQSQQSGVGQSVALEALGSLSGAESAVTKTVPIDEFRFGSTYSSRSGRTEPTVTIGKRLSERIRASVTTSLSDSNELRSNIEYRATESLSFEGSYDNAQSSGSTNVGNVGGDVRWRLEFE